MAAKVTVKPWNVWHYYCRNKEKLKTESEVIAENEEYGIEVYIQVNDDGFLEAYVMMDSDEVWFEEALNEQDCDRMMDEIYETYIYASTSDLISMIEDEIEMQAIEEQEVIDDRESDLDAAAYDFACTLLDRLDGHDESKVADAIKEHICEWLFTDCNISVYRPMYLETESGAKEFHEHPYPEMEIETK